MLEVFKSLRERVRVRANGVRIDSSVSALHYRVTATLLLACCALVTSRQYFGQPIQCLQDESGDDATLPEKVLNTYCFITSTYTVVDDQGTTFSHGVGPDDLQETTARKHHAYYQWVPVILLLQALMFSWPHALWGHWEGHLVQGCLVGISGVLLHRHVLEERMSTLARYVAARIGTFKLWAVGLVFSEFLNFANILLNTLLIDMLLGGSFIQYGLQVFKFLTHTHGVTGVSPMDVTFPKMTKCLFYKYGPTGSIQRHDALCIMPLNVVNEKLFTALWWWFLILGSITALALLWRIFTLLIMSKNQSLVLAQQCVATPMLIPRAELAPLEGKLSISDWLFLSQLGHNLGPVYYRLLMARLTQQVAALKQDKLLRLARLDSIVSNSEH